MFTYGTGKMEITKDWIRYFPYFAFCYGSNEETQVEKMNKHRIE